MKKSITLFALALVSFTNVTLAHNAATSKEILTAANASKPSDYNDLLGAKYVSYADANLIATELGGLKKSAKTISDIIGSDLKITEGKNPKKIALKKKAAKTQKINLNKQIKN